MSGRSIRPEHAVQLLDPSLLGFVQPSLEAYEYHPVGSLGLAVGLGVLDGCEMLGRTKLCDKFVEGVIRELGPIIGDYRLWDAETSHNISLVEAKDVLGNDFGQGFILYPLSEVVDRYNQIFILIGSNHEWVEEV